MKKNYIIALVIYLVVHFSGLLGTPDFISTANWLVTRYGIGLLVILLILNNDLIKTKKIKKGIKESFYWAIGGVFLVFVAQLVAVLINKSLGLQLESLNTSKLINQMTFFPITIVLTSLIAPITEEMIFRKILFRTLQKKTGFFVSTLISSTLFALTHFELSHLLNYIAMGFVFSFVYDRTNRITVPIVTHFLMNTITTISFFLLN